MATNDPARLVLRADGWRNLYTALGDISRDKRRGQIHDTEPIFETDAEDLWRGDAIAARIIEKPVRIQLRGGFDVEITDTTPADPPEDLDPTERLDRRRSRRDLFPTGKKVDPTTKVTDPNSGGNDPLNPDPLKSKLGTGTGADTEKAKEWAKGLAKKIKQLKVRKHLRRCAEYRKAYGGAAMLLGLNDGEDPTMPVDLAKLQSVDWIAVLRPREVMVSSYYRDPLKENFGEPKFYWVQRETKGSVVAPRVKVHASRMVRFDGVSTSERTRAMNNGWGDSIFTRLYPILADFQGGWAASSALLQDFAQAVFKMKGLAELLLLKDGGKVMLERAKAIDLSRSVARAMMIDETEEFERKTTPITGLAELLDRWCNLLAAAADVPVTILMGEAPAGLNATGESDLRSWYDSLAAEREEEYEAPLEILLRYVFLSANGPTDGTEPAEWSIGWKPLYQLTELQEAERNAKQAEADKTYIDATVITPEEVAISRFSGPKYSMRTVLDQEARSVEPPKGPNVPLPDPSLLDPLNPLSGGGKGKPPAGKKPPGKGNPFAK